MKATYTLDRNASSSVKTNVLTQVLKLFGSKVTVSGDAITLNVLSNVSMEEHKLADILNKSRVKYTRSA